MQKHEIKPPTEELVEVVAAFGYTFAVWAVGRTSFRFRSTRSNRRELAESKRCAAPDGERGKSR
jgi:hypothetical protein